MDGLFDEPSARAVNSSPPSCYKDSIKQVVLLGIEVNLNAKCVRVTNQNES